MHENISQHILRLGLAKIARAVVEVTFDQKIHPLTTKLAVFDCADGAELIFKAAILEKESKKMESGNQISELRLNQIVYGAQFSFLKLPKALKDGTGYKIKNTDYYNFFYNIRRILLLDEIDDEKLILSTLKFAFEIVEPMIIHFWNDLIIVHAPQYCNFDVDIKLKEHLDRLGVKSHYRSNDAE